MFGLGLHLGRSDNTRINHDVVLYSNQASPNTTTIKFIVPAGNSLSVNWGDGANEAVVCDGTLKTLTHDYAAAGLYGIALEGDLSEVTRLDADSQTWIEGNISGFVILPGLEDLRINGSSMSGDLTSLNNLTSATNLDVSDSSISSYTTGSLPAWVGCTIDISDLGLTSVEVDDFINDLNDGDGAGGTLTIDGTNAAHSTASDAGITALEANSWTVNANDYALVSNQVSGLNTTTVRVAASSGTLTIRWGDGDTDAVTCDGGLKLMTHDYTPQEKWGIDFTGDVGNVTRVQAYGQAWVEGDIGNISAFTGLTELTISGTGMSGAIAGIASLTSLDYLGLGGVSGITGALSDISALTAMGTFDVFGTALTGSLADISTWTALTHFNVANLSGINGNVSNLAGRTGMTYLRVEGTGVTGDLNSFASMTSLTVFNAYNSSISAYTTGALPAWADCSIQIQNLGLTSTEVDNFLIDLEDGGGNGNDGTLIIAGTNAARTSASDTAKANLITDGWSITVNE